MSESGIKHEMKTVCGNFGRECVAELTIGRSTLQLSIKGPYSWSSFYYVKIDIYILLLHIKFPTICLLEYSFGFSFLSLHTSTMLFSSINNFSCFLPVSVLKNIASAVSNLIKTLLKSPNIKTLLYFFKIPVKH